MKTHIFIATTQGLVAVQNITPIDDEDISSVVSVNGTSTTANISGSYHNFVKKGVGIIHQMFGACSYRVDISARIDQGNSWQVAMYLAHLAQSKGLLGNGEVSQGDSVICATGEVNTSNLQVLAVSDVAIKFKLAQPQLEQWTALGAKVQFILPHGNQSEVEKNHYCLLISNLEQAAAALPNITQNQPAPSVKNRKLVSTNSYYIIAASILLLLLMLFFGITYFLATESSEPLSPAQKALTAKVEPTINTQLVAVLKQGKTCAQTASQNIPLTHQTFADLGLKQLCELYLQTHQSQFQILLVARDAYTVMPLTQNQQGWQIPLPKNRLSSRSYFLVSTATILREEQIEQLRLYREAMPKPAMLTGSTLADWFRKQKVVFVVYTHTLVVE
ncbi:hypothetical protein [Paraglaciecola sp. MB-3u-78]|uniref:hypothetical protein n=1 Tax=Paraglaciecola sp. MB-3u-78 TaxID=2058332 RepID=UPI000C34FA2A|nr:hypothetical protein [Paraglaciecola sp. MB-3u-78]PKG95604.1 hypothetical protein CXF95_25925 [Paraglaciecola sp. MB-3u-78]